jgi:hypothetical protein
MKVLVPMVVVVYIVMQCGVCLAQEQRPCPTSCMTRITALQNKVTALETALKAVPALQTTSFSLTQGGDSQTKSGDLPIGVLLVQLEVGGQTAVIVPTPGQSQTVRANCTTGGASDVRATIDTTRKVTMRLSGSCPMKVNLTVLSKP